MSDVCDNSFVKNVKTCTDQMLYKEINNSGMLRAIHCKSSLYQERHLSSAHVRSVQAGHSLHIDAQAVSAHSGVGARCRLRQRTAKPELQDHVQICPDSRGEYQTSLDQIVCGSDWSWAQSGSERFKS